MQSYLTASRLVTKLKMLRSGKKSKTFLVVEGITDFRLYGKLIKADACEVIIAESKHNVLEATQQCVKEEMPGVVGIVDADFSHLDGEGLPKGVVRTDAHDLECMMLQSPAFDNVLLEYADSLKLGRFEAKHQKKLMDLILDAGAKIGYLRWQALINQWQLRFSQLNFELFMIKEHLLVDEKELIEDIISSSKKQTGVDEDLLKELLRQYSIKAIDRWQLCCGHDLMVILSMGLSEMVGNYNARSLFPGQLEGNFRLAYTKDYFQNTQLYQSLRKWEEENAPYSIF